MHGDRQDHFGIHLNTGPDWDTDEAAVRYYSSPGWGVSAKLAQKSFVGAVYSVFRLMERWGVEFKNPDS